MNPTPSSQDTPDTPQPVAYDAQGRPLYAHPPTPQPTVVHVSRAHTPEQPVISPEVQRKHERSKHVYPFLNLSDGEYVIRAVRRHPIGLIIPLAVGTLLLAMVFMVLVSYSDIIAKVNLTGALANTGAVSVFLLLFAVLIGLGMFIVYYVYTHNKFFLTNESVIQEIQHSLFSHHEQTVSLANIEDASYTKHGIIQSLFNYGDIRLSTEGDETTYRFSYVANPKEHIARLNNAVEAFKNGRPVDDD